MNTFMKMVSWLLCECDMTLLWLADHRHDLALAGRLPNTE